jgi:hypothetical protein
MHGPIIAWYHPSASLGDDDEESTLTDDGQIIWMRLVRDR